MIGWNHFLRGRLSTAFSPIIRKYYSTNKLGKAFKVSSWYRNLTVSLFQIHSTSWNTFCYIVPSKEIQPPTKESLITLIHKYYKKCTELPTAKRKWFSRKLITMRTGLYQNYKNGYVLLVGSLEKIIKFKIIFKN